jgi:cytochrome P450
VVGHALFGADLSGDADRLARATLQALDVVIARARVPITPPQWVPTAGNVRLRRANAELDRAVRAMTSARMSRSAEPEQPDMLDLLLAVRDDHGAPLTQEQIRDQMVTFIVAGHETVASALTWSWALLASHPQWQQALQVEADTVLGERLPTIEDYQRLTVARAIQDEALRLYPPAWLITRKSRATEVLGGCEVPGGALIIMSPWLLHRHPQVWPNPEQFDPSRFLEGAAERSAFIPFGAGPRLCIGRDFALVEGALMLSGLARRFNLSYPTGGALPQAEPLVTIRPHGGLPLVIQRRSAGPSA